LADDWPYLPNDFKDFVIVVELTAAEVDPITLSHFLESLPNKITAMILDNLSWPWVAAHLFTVKKVLNARNGVVVDADKFWSTCCFVNDGQCLDFSILLFPGTEVEIYQASHGQ
jgi:hypothetical protein